MNEPMDCDLIVFSHLRWDFVFQRPQHLLTRFAKSQRIFYVEEPVHRKNTPSIEVRLGQNGVCVVTPYIPEHLNDKQSHLVQRQLLNSLIREYEIEDYALWYYTPMALPFSRHLNPRAVIYDCMDELSMFHGAHEDLLNYESQLFNLADVVFTGGHNLYEYKKERHPNVHPFPSSIEYDHFHKARSKNLKVPDDQARLPGPKIGYYGVIDERMDLALLDGIAEARPEWQIILLGPTAKISPDLLPRRRNIHYLGSKDYKDLPTYISQWNVALLPFAKNDSTRFISPTKTPEYLAAGIPVVSTSIRDVVRPYGDQGLVYIADDLQKFISNIESALELKAKDNEWIDRVDHFLAEMSWDKTWNDMSQLVTAAVSKKLIQYSEVS